MMASAQRAGRRRATAALLVGLAALIAGCAASADATLQGPALVFFFTDP
jgi:hypothetical protein